MHLTYYIVQAFENLQLHMYIPTHIDIFVGPLLLKKCLAQGAILYICIYTKAFIYMYVKAPEITTFDAEL
jgi:hypothetical protein